MITPAPAAVTVGDERHGPRFTARLYPFELCEHDALASGLDADTLHEQVDNILARYSDEKMDDVLAVRHIRAVGRSRLDKARLLAGVAKPLSSPSRSPQGGTAPAPSLLFGAGASPQPPLRSPSSRDIQGHAAAAAASDAKAEEAALETTPLRRNTQHLAAALSPLLPIASAVTGGDASTNFAMAAVGAGLSAASSLTASVATHEHHVQSQDMSKKLQRLALEQDRLHHEAAQSLAENLQADSLAQEARQHRQALWREQQMMDRSLAQERRLHRSALRVDHRLHFEGILADLREQDREADRDLWEQRTERFQMLMTVSGLLVAGGFTLAAEAQMPAAEGCWAFNNPTNKLCGDADAGGDPGGISTITVVYYVLLAVGLGLQFCNIMGCLSLISRFAEFMNLRVQKQQLINKDLRRVALRMLGEDSSRSPEEDEDNVVRFEMLLRKQYVIETCEGGHAGKHVWDFDDWYKQRCTMLQVFSETCFRLGFYALMGAICTYIYAIMYRGDPTVSAQSPDAGTSFLVTLGVLLFIATVVPNLWGASWFWRLRRDKLRGGTIRNCWGLFAPHKPVRFDATDLSRTAEELFNKIDKDGNNTLSVEELDLAAKDAGDAALEKAKAFEEGKFSHTRRPSVHPLASGNSGNGARFPRCPTRIPSGMSDASAASSAVSEASAGTAPPPHFFGAGGAGGAADDDDLDAPAPPFARNHHSRDPTLRLSDSPRADDDWKWRVKKEQAAADEVLETIIRRMKIATESRQRYAARGGRRHLAHAPNPPPPNFNLDAGALAETERAAGGLEGGGGGGGAGGVAARNGNCKKKENSFRSWHRNGHKKRWELTREEWNEGISDALF